MRRLARRAAALIALACLAFLLVRAAATFDYSAHTFRLIEWLRHDVSVAKGLAAVTLLTAIGTPMMVTTTPPPARQPLRRRRRCRRRASALAVRLLQ